MLRLVSRSSALARPASRRTLVSTVLLNRDWQNESLADIKAALRKHGLSQKGNKATLITRMQEYEQQRGIDLVAPTPSPASPAGQARKASTTNVPGIPGTAQPPPPPLPQDFIAVKLPDLSTPDPELPVQIPSTPDFWESSLEKTPHAAVAEPAAPAAPKLLVVGGSATHHGGGPSGEAYELEEPSQPPPSSPAPSSSPYAISALWRDLADDIGIPPEGLKLPERTKEAKRVLSELGVPEATETSGAEKNYERKLDGQEKRGVWILIGLLFGGWLAGGVNS
ncbi:hypothetical protein NEOLEDRAFT_1132051 [Neolentinus lepideus HHB14362 ss-1]|uniref:SAP domain-containing protein n=1 Tax=Neolentinus lepideus HHB14362 ss-1 TaxID=1314782 RepID=A0A165TEA5_9AGAM|nr:hypothetical protein NEOLEDRAFT_1132051 [Neolentinus lepideus HHB14362 ss-1]